MWARKFYSPLLLLPFLVLAFALSSAGLSSAGGPFPLPGIKGWKPAGEVQVFSPGNLFEYINGAADLYLNYEFRELKVAEYRSDGQASVTVEVYRHKSPLLAFGIYSQERSPAGKFLPIGAQGYSDKGYLNFLIGDAYVKISSYKTGEDDRGVLLQFARAVARNLGGVASLPALLPAFPQEGKKENAEKFILKNFLGYSFLHSGFTADYEIPGKKFQLFIISGKDAADREKMLRDYFKRAGKDWDGSKEGKSRVADPYHGELDLAWKGAYIWGVLNVSDPATRAKYLTLLGEGLARINPKS